jgi:hypothetical protein
VGAAYRLGKNLVLRGGFGICYLPSNTGHFSSPNEYGEEPFSPGTQMIPYGTNPNGIAANEVHRFGAHRPGYWLECLSTTNLWRIERALHKPVEEWSCQAGQRIPGEIVRKPGPVAGLSGYNFSYSDNLANRNGPLHSIQNIPAGTLSSWLSQYIASNRQNRGQTDPQV